MANKYVYHGATFDGDGTSPNPATSNGGVGAWNNLKSVLEGNITYGSLSPGDKVYIRSKDASDSNFSILFSNAIAVGVPGVANNHVFYIIDNGSVWGGVDGTVTIQFNANITLGDYTVWIAKRKGALVFEQINSSQYDMYFRYGLAKNVVFITNGAYLSLVGSYLIDCKNENIATSTVVIGVRASYGRNTCVGNDFSFPNAAINTYVYPFHGINSSVRGQVYGANVNPNISNNLYIYAPRSILWDIYGLKDTRERDYVFGINGWAYQVNSKMFDYHSAGVGLQFYYRIDGKGDHPRLLSNSPFYEKYNSTVALYPYNNQITPAYPAYYIMKKYYNMTPATRTITVNFLSPKIFPVPTKERVWIDVTYLQDSDNRAKTVSTLTGDRGEIDVSNALWDKTNFCNYRYDKRKLVIATPTAIKKNTFVYVMFVWSISAYNYGGNIPVFLDPNFEIE